MATKIKGTPNKDTMIGGIEENWFAAGADKDYLDGGAGNDTLDGGSDDDTIYGGTGNDYIDGDSAQDLIDAGEGNDTVIAGSGHDTVTAGAGNDTLNAGSGDDHVKHIVGENQGFTDKYDGGSGYDILELCVTQQEAVLYANEIQAIQNFIASGSKEWFHIMIGTNDFTFRWFEGFELCINGGQIPIPPDAVDDSKVITEDDAAAAGNVLTNDTDPNGDPLTVTNPGVYVGAHGTLTLNANGTYNYAHNVAGDQGLDTGQSVQDVFNVDITDGGLNDSSTLTITINGVNDAPNSHQPNGTAAGDDVNSLGEDDPSVGGNVLTNDTDPEGDALSVANAGVYVGTYGTLTLNANGTYTYANNVAANQFLDTGQSVQDVFNVTVSDGDLTDPTLLTITINGQNDAPNSHQPNGTAAGDDVNSLTEDQVSVNGNVLTNDTDPEGDALSVANAGVYVGAHGTLTLNANGTYTYANNVAANQYLDTGQSVQDVFNVTVSDGALTDPTLLTITINGLNDAPNSHQPNGTAAGDDVNSLGEDDPSVGGNVLTNDTDPEGDALSVANAGVYVGAHGTLTLNANGTYTYANNVAANQYLDTGQSVQDVFNVTVSDGSLTDPTLLTITINGQNDKPNSNPQNDPTAGDDLKIIDEDTANAAGNVLTNDTDPENDVLSVANPGVYVGAHGTLTLNADGSYSYAHDTAGSQGLGVGDSFFDVFGVTVSDGALTDNTNLTIRIDGLNEAPQTVNDVNSLTEDQTNVGGNVLSNDSDPDADPLTVGNAGVLVGTHGTLTLNADGSYNYVINPANFQSMTDGQVLHDIFNYSASDGTTTTGGQLDISINGINDAPTAVDDVAVATVKAGVNTALFGNVLTNDSDPEQAANTLNVINYTKTSATNFGTFNHNADGSWTFFISVLPADGVTVVETWEYTIQDNGGLTDVGQLSFEITGSI